MSFRDFSSWPGVDNCAENQSKSGLVLRLSPGAWGKLGAWEPCRAHLRCLGAPQGPHHSCWRRSPQFPPVPAAPALASGAAVIGTGSRSCSSAGPDPPTRGFAEVRSSCSPRLPLGAEPHPSARPSGVTRRSGRWREAAPPAVGGQAGASPALEAARRPATLLVRGKESDRCAGCVRSGRASFPAG